jgi:hypothetical protein
MVDVVSRILHPRSLDVLGAFVPGLFLEACLLLAKPQVVVALLDRANVDRYVPLFIALIMAFVVGSAFLLWVRSLEILFVGVCGRIVARSSRAVAEFLVARVPFGPGPEQESTYVRFLRRRRDRYVERAQLKRDLVCAWTLVAAATLKEYGVEGPPALEWDRELDPWSTRGWQRWLPWARVLGSRRFSELPGHSVIVMLHATGWSGLAARLLAPELQIRPFTFLWVFLIVFGVWHDVSLAWWVGHPVNSWYIGLQTTFWDLQKAACASHKSAPEVGAN